MNPFTSTGPASDQTAPTGQAASTGHTAQAAPAGQTGPTGPASRAAPTGPTAPTGQSAPTGQTAAAAAGAVLELRDAAVRVGGRILWSGVDLTVGRGEFVAVLGPNGAGKSTLLKVLLGLLPTAAGQVLVLGQPPGRASHRIGYLPQRRSFDASVRIRGTDVVRLGLDGDRWGLPLPAGKRSRAAAQQVREVIDLVGASSYAGRPIGECSGGEQQRLLLAQALIRQPDLLLLDEPLDSLDLPSQATAAALISRICREQGVTIVMVAHDVNPILSHLDRVVYMAAGGAACGTPAEVITSQTLTRLYQTPVEVLTASDGRLVVVGQPEPPAVHSDRHAGNVDHEHHDSHDHHTHPSGAAP